MTGSGLGAGPAVTWPSVMLNLLPWHGQSMVPSATLLTVQPMCVQIALKALYSPVAGWVTTTLAALNTFPPPSGISLAEPSTVPPPADTESLAAADLLAGAALVVLAADALLPDALLPDALDEQALSTPARPARPSPAPAPASTVRRLPAISSTATVTSGHSRNYSP